MFSFCLPDKFSCVIGQNDSGLLSSANFRSQVEAWVEDSNEETEVQVWLLILIILWKFLERNWSTFNLSVMESVFMEAIKKKQDVICIGKKSVRKSFDHFSNVMFDWQMDSDYVPRWVDFMKNSFFVFFVRMGFKNHMIGTRCVLGNQYFFLWKLNLFSVQNVQF